MTVYNHECMYGRSGCEDDRVRVYFLTSCTVGTSMLLRWPSAWNEKCLMPLVCLEGLFSFSEDGQPCIIDYKTLLQCYFISIAKLTRNWGFIYFCFFIPDSVCIMCAPLVCVCVWCLPVCPLSHLLFTVTPSGRLNGRYAETTPLSPHPSARCADRELRKTKDKR